ncbi:MAG: hypothetical protein ACRDUA_25630, partial [Micromonosporaceae bacterium]
GLWSLGSRGARKEVLAQAADPDSAFQQQLLRRLDTHRQAALDSGLGAARLPLSDLNVADHELRAALKPYLPTLGFQTPVAAVHHAHHPGAGIIDLDESYDPGGDNPPLSRYHRAMSATLAQPDQVTVNRRPDGSVEVVLQRVAHNSQGDLATTRKGPVVMTATVVVRDGDTGVVAVVEAFTAAPDHSFEGRGQRLTSRTRVLDAVKETDARIAFEVDADTVFPAPDVPNTVVIKPPDQDAFDATVDYDPISGKLTLVSGGNTAHAVVDAAKDARHQELFLAVEAALADAVGQLQAKALGAKVSMFRHENVLRPGELVDQIGLVDLTVADHGRMARMRVLHRQYHT